jgi:large subunit ribosomal protein L23
MALLGLGRIKRKKAGEKEAVAALEKEEAERAAPKAAQARGLSSVPGRDISSVLVRPRITEKATAQAEKNVYVFEVMPSASKRDVREAVTAVYKVHPVKIHIVRVPPRKVVSRLRGSRGTRAGYKKAYVYLKEGDRIEVV